MPPSEITAISLVPPPMSTTIRPTGSAMLRPAPIAAAIGSSIKVDATRPGCERGLLDGPLLDLGHARRRAHDQPRMGAAAVEDLADEVAEHLLGDLEVGDHPVTEGSGRRDRRGRATDHPLGLRSDGVDATGLGVRRDHRGLRHHDPPPADIDEGVGRPEVDRHIPHSERGSEMSARDVPARAISAEAHQDRVANSGWQGVRAVKTAG